MPGCRSLRQCSVAQPSGVFRDPWSLFHLWRTCSDAPRACWESLASQGASKSYFASIQRPNKHRNRSIRFPVATPPMSAMTRFPVAGAVAGGGDRRRVRNNSFSEKGLQNTRDLSSVQTNFVILCRKHLTPPVWAAMMGSVSDGQSVGGQSVVVRFSS
jgi:hypothetical protein